MGVVTDLVPLFIRVHLWLRVLQRGAPTMKDGLQVTRLSASLGAEVRGIRLDEAGPAQAAAIRSLLLEHLVLFFPAQRMTPDEHIAFGRFLEAGRGKKDA
jgi:hypothetical protein